MSSPSSLTVRSSWTHPRTCIVAGVGFLTDAYDIFTISIGASMIGYVYVRCTLIVNQDMGIKVATPIGRSIVGLIMRSIGVV